MSLPTPPTTFKVCLRKSLNGGLHAQTGKRLPKQFVLEIKKFSKISKVPYINDQGSC